MLRMTRKLMPPPLDYEPPKRTSDYPAELLALSLILDILAFLSLLLLMRESWRLSAMLSSSAIISGALGLKTARANGYGTFALWLAALGGVGISILALLSRFRIF